MIKRHFFLFLLVPLLPLLFFSCSWMITDDDKTKCIYYSEYQGAMSIGLFEVKEDNTFRYWYVNLGDPTNIEGKWYYRGDTIILHKYRDSTTTYGKIFLRFHTLSQSKVDTIPSFILSETDSLTLKHITYENDKRSIRYCNPPRDIFFRVNRTKANMKIKKK